MKFLNLGLFTLSSLFAATSAAPAPQGSLVPSVPVDVKQPNAEVELNQRSDNVVCRKLEITLVEVKKHTSKINSTVESVDKDSSKEDKLPIIQLVKSEVTIIIGLVTKVADEVLELVGETLEEVDQKKLIQLVLDLIFEILFTLKNVITVLGISIFELLGNLVFALLSVVGHLLATLNIIVDGLLKIVFTALGEVVDILSVVLSGLLPLVSGVVGGLLNAVGGLLTCLL